MSASPDLLSRFQGCLLGHLVGDALGAPFEGLSSELIMAQFGRPAGIVANPPLEKLFYSDDTQMSIALAETLCAHKTVDEDKLIQAFAAAFDPKRGYGQGARRLLESVILKEDWRSLRQSMFPGGSFGNGGAMRVAPIGLYFHDNLNQVWDQAGRSAAVTHMHPLGVQGAQLLAIAVALATRGQAGDRDTFYRELYDRASEEEYQWLLRVSWNLSANDSLSNLGSGLEAHRSVVTAITCFSINPDSFENTLARALALGNDTDTVMAMAGAISGAHLGADAIPDHLLNRIENDAKGRDHVRELASLLLNARSASSS